MPNVNDATQVGAAHVGHTLSRMGSGFPSASFVPGADPHPPETCTHEQYSSGRALQQARQQVLRTVDTVQVRTCWEVGRHIVEYGQGGKNRARYGAKLLPQLAERLTAEFGKGFDASNLRYMRPFFQAFPNCDALRHELSWTHYRLLLRVDDAKARPWYMAEAASQNWGTRALERQIGTLSARSGVRRSIEISSRRGSPENRITAHRYGHGRGRGGV